MSVPNEIENKAQQLKAFVDAKHDAKSFGEYLQRGMAEDGIYVVATMLYEIEQGPQGAQHRDAINAALNTFSQKDQKEKWMLVDAITRINDNKKAVVKSEPVAPSNPSLLRKAGAALMGVPIGLFSGALVFEGAAAGAVMRRGDLLTKNVSKKIWDSELPGPLKWVLDKAWKGLMAIVSIVPIVFAGIIGAAIGFIVGLVKGPVEGWRQGSPLAGARSVKDMADGLSKSTLVEEYRAARSPDERIKFLVGLGRSGLGDNYIFSAIAAIRIDLQGDATRRSEFDDIVQRCFSPGAISAINAEVHKIFQSENSSARGELQPLLPPQPESEAKNEVMGGSTTVMHDELHPNLPQDEKKKELQHTQADLKAVDEKVGEEKEKEKDASSSVDNVATTVAADTATANEDVEDAEEEEEEEEEEGENTPEPKHN